MNKILVYYSYGGATRAVAKKITNKLKVKSVELHTVKQYPDDFDVLLSLTKKEIEIGVVPPLVPLKVDFSKYDAVILGFPVWWRSVPPAIKSFLKSVDWKGKTVYPFVTSEGKLGHVNSDLKKAVRGGMVCPLLKVEFDKEGNQLTKPNEIVNWANAVAEDGYDEEDD